MPGRQDVYEAAMREAADAAWDHNWERAVEAYLTAVEEFPQDPNALAGLGLALVEAERLEQALEVYNHITQLAPGDPIALEKSAEVLERMGHLEEAAHKYMEVAEIYLSRRDKRAIANWERAARLDPAMLEARSRLAVIYERAKQPQAAVHEYLALAAIFHQQGDDKKTYQALRRALRLDPTNDQVRNNLAALQAGGELTFVGGIKAQEPPAQPSDFDPFGAGVSVREAPPKSRDPVAEATEQAMTQLAEYIFEESMPLQAQAALSRAINLQRLGEAAQAVEAYRQVLDLGVDHPALRLNLGVMYEQAGQHAEAISTLEPLAVQPDLGIVTNLTMSQANLAEDRVPRAVYYAVLALRHADETVSGTNGPAFEQMLAGLEGQDEKRLRSLAEALILLLDSDDWRDRMAEMRAQLDAHGGSIANAVERLAEPGAELVTDSVRRIEEYMAQGMLGPAMEEALVAVERAPAYLPAHARIAELLALDGRLSEATEKYNLIASSYLARGDPERAAGIFTKVLSMSPTDVEARRYLITMLLGQQRVDEALRQYQELAEVYLSLADVESTWQVYNEAYQQAKSHNASPQHIKEVLHALGDMDVQRLDWQRALRAYEEILALDSADEKAWLAVVDLHFRLRQSREAIQALDEYLKHCIRSGKLERVLSTLEELVRSQPDEADLRQRLAEVYRQQGRISDAIAQLDALGELQLEAGDQSGATRTIRRIVSLNPPDVDDYRTLLEQLEGSGPASGPPEQIR
jgi:tetratricopeptide (TPR) repeat protein